MTSYLYGWNEGTPGGGLKPGEIARIPTTGFGPNEMAWIKGLTQEVTSIALSTTHIYWSEHLIGINRAKLDGTEIEKEWLIPSEPSTQFLIATDETFLYWMNSKNIGRVKLDGSEINNEFIKNPSEGFSPKTFSVNSQYLYWTQEWGGLGHVSVGRVKINGTNPEHVWQDLGLSVTPIGQAVTNSHIYIQDKNTNIIRLTIEGELEKEWYKQSSPTTAGLATAGNYLYFLSGGWFVGRIQLNKTHAENDWINHLAEGIEVLAITPEAPPCIKPTDPEAPWELFLA